MSIPARPSTAGSQAPTSTADGQPLDPHVTADVLVEALPYIQTFRGARVVIKYGGHAMSSPELADLFAQDVVLMLHLGMKPIVVHGGGPQISDLMRRLGKEPEFVDGLRVTDAETVDIVRMALIGQVNRQIVTRMNASGPFAVGLGGEDAGLIRVTQRDPRLGFVGDVERVNPEIIEKLLSEDLIPVVAGIGVDDKGNVYNVNADAIAAAVAQSLGAQKLVYLTDVPGLLRDVANPESLIDEVDLDQLDRLVGEGAIHSGMVPKLESIAAAIRGGVNRAHILDGRIPHVLLIELFTRRGIGTMIWNGTEQ